MTPQR